MPKPLDPTVSFAYDLPAGYGVDGVRVDKTGWVAFLEKEVKEIDVAGVQRLVTHERRKGPRVRTRQGLAGIRLSVDGLQELCSYTRCS